MLAVASHRSAIVDTNKPVKQLVGAGVGAGGMAGLQPAARAKPLANFLKLQRAATIRSYSRILDLGRLQ